MITIDDFLSEEAYSRIRKRALEAEYTDWKGHDGQVYKRISIVDIPEIHDILEYIYGDINMLGMAFRANFEGELPNQSIHTDLGWGTHALVLYLTDGDSGTAFWRHSPSRLLTLSPTDIDGYNKVKDDWTHESRWEMVDFVKMKSNRALIYSSELFHSRWPFEGFGTSLEDGRLILVAFFTPTKKEVRWQVNA